MRRQDLIPIKSASELGSPDKEAQTTTTDRVPRELPQLRRTLGVEAMESHRWEKNIEPSSGTENIGSPIVVATGVFAAIGYSRLCDITGLAKRTVQRAIARP